jgi:plasmid stabilization system protein ParE
LKPRRVRFTETAQRQVRREKEWWLKNRDHADVFAAELETALRILALLPGAGTEYPQAHVAGLRRAYVPKVACHLYYTFDDREVIVRAFWGARRGRGPEVNP